MSSEQPGLLQDPHVREAYPVLQDVVYLNVGTYGIMPASALADFQSMQADFESHGVASKHTWGRRGSYGRVYTPKTSSMWKTNSPLGSPGRQYCCFSHGLISFF